MNAATTHLDWAGGATYASLPGDVDRAVRRMAGGSTVGDRVEPAGAAACLELVTSLDASDDLTSPGHLLR